MFTKGLPDVFLKIVFLKHLFSFIYLAALDLSYNTQDLQSSL